jgi:hypothetical protein
MRRRAAFLLNWSSSRQAARLVGAAIERIKKAFPRVLIASIMAGSAPKELTTGERSPHPARTRGRRPS